MGTRALLMALILLAGASGQQQTSGTPEIKATDTVLPPTFSTRVNLVLVPVVVRDKKGHAVGTLQKDDFQLFDRGQAQIISKFSLEKGERAPVQIHAEDGSVPNATPDRFLLYVFDDLHLRRDAAPGVTDGSMGMPVAAAKRHLQQILSPTTRAAIFTTSGKVIQDFTNDRGALFNALDRILPRSKSEMSSQCPDFTYRTALAFLRHDPGVTSDALAQTMTCGSIPVNGSPGYSPQQMASAMATAVAERVIQVGAMESEQSVKMLAEMVRRLSGMPGERNMVIASPGFLVVNGHDHVMELLDHAIRANVVISALDLRGYYGVGITGYNPNGMALSTTTERELGSLEGDILGELAYGTGGTYFHDNNDVDEGFRQVSRSPEFYYVLGFSPKDLKMDGSFHLLKVKLRDPSGLTVQARPSYTAPKRDVDPAEQIKNEMTDALFARDESPGFPVDVHTQFFKADNNSVSLTVTTRVGLRGLRFQKSGGRNLDKLTVMSAVFDHNGNWVSGLQKDLEINLPDATLQARLNSGVSIRSQFEIIPGQYILRVVARDAEGQMMATKSVALAIP